MGKGGGRRLTVVIPVFNEREALITLVPKLLEYAEEKMWRLVFVDDASTDGSFEMLCRTSRSPAFRVVRHAENRGYGGALKTGIYAAKTEYVATMDADGQHRPVDVDRLFQVIDQEGVDMVIGSRPAMSTGLYRGLGRQLIRFVAGLFLSVSVKDLNSGLKIYRTAEAQCYVQKCPEGMAFSDIITLTFEQKGHRVLEEDIQTGPRMGGKSTVTTLTAFQTIREIMSMAAVVAPNRTFFSLGAVGVGLYLAGGALVGGVSGGMNSLVFGVGFFICLKRLIKIGRVRTGEDVVTHSWRHSGNAATTSGG